ncbi:hypothetical protein KAR26_00010 [Candidatus Parcubacteria bacterium]|nr:hypothetical protein [Candidatus Parcubacteria bacterium]
MDFLERMRNLPLAKRKAILWIIIAIIGIVLMNWWLGNFLEKLESPEELWPEIPSVDIEEVFEDVPEFNISPELLEELELEKAATSSLEKEELNPIEGEQEELKENN